MSLEKVCEKIRELVDKAREEGDKLLTFYGWQWDVLPNVYAQVALLLYGEEDLENDLKEKISTIHKMMARLIHHTHGVWIACSAITDIPQNYLEDEVIKAHCNIDRLIGFINSALNEIEDAYRKCDYYLKQAIMESKMILENIDYISIQPRLIRQRIYDTLLDVYDWVAVNYADIEYLSKTIHNVYNEISEGLKAARDELIDLAQQVEAQKKEEKKEGGK